MNDLVFSSSSLLCYIPISILFFFIYCLSIKLHEQKHQQSHAMHASVPQCVCICLVNWYDALVTNNIVPFDIWRLPYFCIHFALFSFISSNIIPSLSNIALQSYTLYCTANFSVRLFVRMNHSLSQTQIQFIALHWGKERRWTRQGERDR